MIVEVPGMGDVEFPDDMSDDDIAAAIKKNLAPTPPRSFGEDLLRQAKLTGRDVVSAAAAIPGMAMDAGVAARNLTEGAVRKYAPTVASRIDDVANRIGIPSGPGPAYSMPSQDFQRALTDVGVPEPVGAAEKGMSFIRQAALGSRLPAPQAAQQAPKDFQPAGQAIRDQTLRKAQSEGYVVPPSANNPSTMNRLLEGLSGKVKLSQEAAMRNAPVTEKLASRGLGQNPDAPITQAALGVIRKEAYDAGYAPVKAVGEIATDTKFLDDLANITKTATGAARSFPGLTPKGEFVEKIGTLAQAKFDASDGIDAVAHLRELADDAYRAGDGSVGKAYKSAAKAIEDMIERDLTKRGGDAEGLLKGYRAARQQIAKTHTAGKALVDEAGGTNARTYASELVKGKPLTGDQRTIGQFASAFGKYAPKPSGDIYPSISPLDAYGSAIAAGATESVAPLAFPLTRLGLREYLLSPAGQARAVRSPQVTPENLGLLGLLPAGADDLSGLFGN